MLIRLSFSISQIPVPTAPYLTVIFIGIALDAAFRFRFS